MAYATTDHIENVNAASFIKGLRREFSGLHKIYGSRYMTQLESICGYHGGSVGEDIQKADKTRPGTFKIVIKVIYILNVCGVRKEFKNAKEAGIYMEKTIESLFDLGILPKV